MNLTGQLADHQHEFSSPKAVYQLYMMRAKFSNSVISVRAWLCRVEQLNLGNTEHIHFGILSVKSAGVMTCTSFGDFISMYNYSYL